MDQQTVIADIERRAGAINLTVREVCRRAGVHPTTFSRWKKTTRNPNPFSATFNSIGKLTDVLDGEERRLAVVVKAHGADHDGGDIVSASDRETGNITKISAQAVTA